MAVFIEIVSGPLGWLAYTLKWYSNTRDVEHAGSQEHANNLGIAIGGMLILPMLWILPALLLPNALPVSSRLAAVIAGAGWILSCIFQAGREFADWNVQFPAALSFAATMGSILTLLGYTFLV